MKLVHAILGFFAMVAAVITGIGCCLLIVNKLMNRPPKEAKVKSVTEGSLSKWADIHLTGTRLIATPYLVEYSTWDGSITVLICDTDIEEKPGILVTSKMEADQLVAAF